MALECPHCGVALSGPVERCEKCGAWLSLADESANAPAEESAPAGDLESRILGLMREGKKIQAIKIHREATGAGLKESKDFVEGLARSHNVPAGGAGCATTSAALVLLAVAIGVWVFF